MKVLDLFSGIGGFSLGLERAGMKTIAFVEIDPFCRKILNKHWPEVPIHDDIRTLDGGRFRGVDVVCGGFPCQDLSVAGKGAGLDGDRSGLWSEYARVIGEARPRYVIVENVAALLGRGLSRVLGDLAALGYDAEWHCIPASAVGAPHRRDRVWIIAYANGIGNRLSEDPLLSGRNGNIDCNWWASEPPICRVDDGVPGRVDRLRALGNAVVPQVAEMIGKAIMRAE